MVKPVPVIAFVLLWRLIAALIAGSDTTAPDTPDCSFTEVFEGCSDFLSAWTLGTISGAPPEVNVFLVWVNVIIAIYLLWCLIVLIRGGAES